MIGQPDWFDLPPEEWPDDAREFYRLVHLGLRRAYEARQAMGNAAPGVERNETPPGQRASK